MKTTITYRQSIQADLMNLLAALNISHITWEDVDAFSNDDILTLTNSYVLRIKHS